MTMRCAFVAGPQAIDVADEGGHVLGRSSHCRRPSARDSVSTTTNTTGCPQAFCAFTIRFRIVLHVGAFARINLPEQRHQGKRNATW